MKLNRDVVAFCMERGSPIYRTAVILEETKANEFVVKGEFSYLLALLWSNEGSSVALEWLRKKEVVLNAVLLYELAIAEFLAAPSVEILQSRCVPLIKKANVRVLQECCCLEGLASLRETIMARMEETYMGHLMAVVMSKIDEEAVAQINCDQEVIKQEIRKVANESFTVDVTGKSWLRWYGANHSAFAEPIAKIKDPRRVVDGIARKLIEKMT